MNLGSIIKKVAITAAPIGVAVLAGPEAGALAGAAVGTAGGAKWVGKRYEAAGGRSLHKSGAPAAAVATSIGLGQFMTAEGMAKLCEAVQQVFTVVCDNPILLLALPALTVISSHGGISDLAKSAGRKTP